MIMFPETIGLVIPKEYAEDMLIRLNRGEHLNPMDEEGIRNALLVALGAIDTKDPAHVQAEKKRREEEAQRPR